MKHKRAFLYILAFVLIGIVSIFILHHDSQSTPIKSAINSVVINAKITEYNVQGDVSTTLSADELMHFETNGETAFTNPHFVTYTTTDRTPWHIHADNGLSDKTGDRIELTNHVVIHQLATATHPEMTITTSELTIFPKESRATTNKPTVLSQPGTVIHGTGFSANLKTGEYQLHSGSEATYDPSKQPHIKSHKKPSEPRGSVVH